MERMTMRDGVIVKLAPAFRRGDFASQNVLHRLADLEDKEQIFEEEESKRKKTSNITFTKEELEVVAFALEHLHDTDLSFLPNKTVSNIESAMDKLNIKYTSQTW